MRPSELGSRPPMKDGVRRDFANLKPSQSARHAPSNRPTPNEKEPMREGPVSFVPHSRGRELGTPPKDIEEKLAIRKRVAKAIGAR